MASTDLDRRVRRERRGARRARTLALALATAAMGCSDGVGSPDVSAGGREAERESARDRAAFDEADVKVRGVDISFMSSVYRASAGTVTIGYVNEGRIRHTLLVEDVDAFGTLRVDRRGDVAVGSVALEAGDYVLYCDVPGHRAAGMEAELRVR